MRSKLGGICPNLQLRQTKLTAILSSSQPQSLFNKASTYQHQGQQLSEWWRIYICIKKYQKAFRDPQYLTLVRGGSTAEDAFPQNHARDSSQKLDRPRQILDNMCIMHALNSLWHNVCCLGWIQSNVSLVCDFKKLLWGPKQLRKKYWVKSSVYKV